MRHIYFAISGPYITGRVLLLWCFFTSYGPGVTLATPSPTQSSDQVSHEPQAAVLSSLGEAVIDQGVWERYYGAVGAVPSLPLNIEQIMNSPCPFWPNKLVKDTHLLVLIPSKIGDKALTLDYLSELIERPQGGGHQTKYRYYSDLARKAVGNQSPSESYWILVTRNVLPDSKSKRYEDQCKLVEAYTTQTRLGYKLPSLLEATVAILLYHVQSGECLYGNNPLTYTRCRDKSSNGYPLVVGGFSSVGLNVDVDNRYAYDIFHDGVAALRKF